MTNRLRTAVGVAAIILGCAVARVPGHSQGITSESGKGQKETAVTGHATGTFEVKVMPQPVEDKDLGIGRMSLDKQFHGDLDGVSKGEMLSASGRVKGSAGYVAIERVSGTLQGRKGSFVLQHNGIMNRGTPQLNISVVPDSGTDQLAGLMGMMTIKIEEGKHSYEFDYTFSGAQ
jgi:hypothetical protein